MEENNFDLIEKYSKKKEVGMRINLAS